MKVKTITGAEGTYACIESEKFSLDVRIHEGMNVQTSLRFHAHTALQDAQRLRQRAERMLEAAAIFETTP